MMMTHYYFDYHYFDFLYRYLAIHPYFLLVFYIFHSSFSLLIAFEEAEEIDFDFVEIIKANDNYYYWKSLLKLVDS
jgi:hypothetical protein